MLMVFSLLLAFAAFTAGQKTESPRGYSYPIGRLEGNAVIVNLPNIPPGQESGKLDLLVCGYPHGGFPLYKPNGAVVTVDPGFEAGLEYFNNESDIEYAVITKYDVNDNVKVYSTVFCP